MVTVDASPLVIVTVATEVSNTVLGTTIEEISSAYEDGCSVLTDTRVFVAREVTVVLLVLSDVTETVA